MSIDERFDRLTAVVESLAASVARHNVQIENLLKSAEESLDEGSRTFRQER
jgi:hypothetical protein